MSPRIRAGAVVAFVFAAGVLCGMLIERHRTGSIPARASVADEHAAAMAELEREVGLDDEQIERVEAILARHREIVRESWEQFRPEVQTAMRQVHVEIAEMLRPEQRARFHEWLMRRREEGRIDYPLEAHEN